MHNYKHIARQLWKRRKNKIWQFSIPVLQRSRMMASKPTFFSMSRRRSPLNCSPCVDSCGVRKQRNLMIIIIIRKKQSRSAEHHEQRGVRIETHSGGSGRYVVGKGGRYVVGREGNVIGKDYTPAGNKQAMTKTTTAISIEKSWAGCQIGKIAFSFASDRLKIEDHPDIRQRFQYPEVRVSVDIPSGERCDGPNSCHIYVGVREEKQVHRDAIRHAFLGELLVKVCLWSQDSLKSKQTKPLSHPHTYSTISLITVIPNFLFSAPLFSSSKRRPLQ